MLTAMAGEEVLSDHPVYGDPSNPVYHKTKQFIEGSRNFISLIKKYQPTTDTREREIATH